MDIPNLLLALAAIAGGVLSWASFISTRRLRASEALTGEADAAKTNSEASILLIGPYREEVKELRQRLVALEKESVLDEQRIAALEHESILDNQRIAELEHESALDQKRIAELEREQAAWLAERREWEIGIGLLLAQMGEASIKPRWKPKTFITGPLQPPK